MSRLNDANESWTFYGTFVFTCDGKDPSFINKKNINL